MTDAELKTMTRSQKLKYLKKLLAKLRPTEREAVIRRAKFKLIQKGGRCD